MEGNLRWTLRRCGNRELPSSDSSSDIQRGEAATHWNHRLNEGPLSGCSWVKDNELPFADYIEIVQTTINQNHRVYMVQFLFEKAKVLNLSPRTIHLAVNILDRYLSLNNISAAEKNLTSLASTCLYIASKNVEPKLSGGGGDTLPVKLQKMLESIPYDNKEVSQMEYKFLTQNTDPTTHRYIGKFFKKIGVVKDNAKLEHLSYFLADLTLFDYGMLCYPTSLVAASCIFLARHMLTVTPVWSAGLVDHATYEAPKLRVCVSRLHGKFCSVWPENLRHSSYAVLMGTGMDSLNRGQIPAGLFLSR